MCPWATVCVDHHDAGIGFFDDGIGERHADRATAEAEVVGLDGMQAHVRSFLDKVGAR